MIRKTKDKVIDAIIIAIITILAIICLVPMLHELAMSLSSNNAILSRKVTLFPVDFTFRSYSVVLGDPAMVHSIVYTAGLTIFYTILSMAMTILVAYPLTKKNLVGANAYMVFVIITMYFSGGIIPDYLLEKELNLLDTPWSLILPRLIDPFNMIILRTFFSNIPESLEESAYLDGASYLTILTRIIIPLSTPVIATLSLFYAVSRWNGFQDALMYISSQEYYPIQMKLYQIIFTNMTNEVAVAEGSSAQMVPEGIKAAAVMVATVPILVVYPWLQRYFVTGVTLGAVKE